MEPIMMERMKQATAAQLLDTFATASAAQWMALRIVCDECGRIDLVAFCIDQAACKYEAEQEAEAA